MAQQGFDLKLYESRTALAANDLTRDLAEVLQRELLERQGERILPTPLGRRFLDTVIAEFLP